MNSIIKIYLNLYVFVYALYVFFNKGISYSFLAEGVLALGVVLIFLNRKSYKILLDKRVYLLLFFLFITTIYFIRGTMNFDWFSVTRDAFMFYYILFAFIMFLFQDELPYLFKRLCLIYKWFPLVACVSFLSLAYIPFFSALKIFGNNHLLLYKSGDMAVHLFISSILFLNGYIQVSKRFLIVNAVLVIYLFFITSTYSRGGMLAFILAFCIYLYFSKEIKWKAILSAYGKYLLIIMIITFPLFLMTNVKENFQGRKLGIDQLKENIVSIVNPNIEGTLSDNKIWRLMWWSKIVQYTFGGEYFLQGKGLGMSLVATDEIITDDAELRSPHNFHLNIVARFGVPIFLVWLCWLFFHFKKIRDKKENQFQLMILAMMSAFIINATFDVFLEGPMGAFPFWTLVGISYVADTFEIQMTPILKS